MLFNTTEFAIFFAVVVVVYALLAKRTRWQNALLLLASYYFYGCWDWRFLGLLLLSTTVDYVIAQKIEDSTNPKHRKRLITASVTFQLGMLGFFKYFNFFIASTQAALAALGLRTSPMTLAIVLPVGISFYAFQTMSYTIDVYRGALKAERRFVEFACFVALFPQLVAGPIERASHLLPQVNAPRTMTLERIYEGSWLIFWGLYKKIYIADNVAVIVDDAFARSGELSRAEAIVALYGFALQIYGDFSGYTDIARGAAKILGFDFNLNFARPYLAVNPSDFWRRWHISLSSWLRDYLYISLGGNRNGSVRTYRNLFLTMVIGGLWHGAAWTFVIWGAYHGLLLVAHRLLQPLLARFDVRSTVGRVAWRFIRVAVMFHLVVLGWLPFRAHSMAELRNFLHAFFSRGGHLLAAARWFDCLVLFGGLLFVYELVEERWPNIKMPVIFRAVAYTAIAISIFVAGSSSGQAFIYFQF